METKKILIFLILELATIGAKNLTTQKKSIWEKFGTVRIRNWTINWSNMTQRTTYPYPQVTINWINWTNPVQFERVSRPYLTKPTRFLCREDALEWLQALSSFYDLPGQSAFGGGRRRRYLEPLASFKNRLDRNHDGFVSLNETLIFFKLD